MLGSNFPLPAQGHGISGREEGQWEGNGQVSWPHRGTAITDPCRELPEDPRAEGRSWGSPHLLYLGLCLLLPPEYRGQRVGVRVLKPASLSWVTLASPLHLSEPLSEPLSPLVASGELQCPSGIGLWGGGG